MQDYYDRMQKSNSKDVPISNYIGQAILMICNNLSKRYNFGSYTYRDEMVSEGLKDCVKGVSSFNPNKTNNPYGFFTMIAWNAFVRVILAEKKQTYIKHKNFQRLNIGSEVLDEQNELSDDVIQAFEDKIARDKAEKKKKQKQKKKNVIPTKQAPSRSTRSAGRRSKPAVVKKRGRKANVSATS